MTLLVSAFGMVGRIAGDLLTSALSWASSLLFGRVPRSRQVFLTLMMALSFAWLVAAAGVILPGLATWLLSTTPQPVPVPRTWLSTAFLVGLVGLPPAVGLAGLLAPGDGQRVRGPAVVREILRGYVLAPVIAGLLIFLAGVGLARKARSARHGWSELHVPIVVEPGGYDELVDDLHDAVADVGLETTAELAPRVLTLPALVLTSVAGPNVRKLRPERLVELAGPELRVGIYPSDIAISGAAPHRTRARAAILSRLASAAAHQTTTAEAQAVEDRLHDLATDVRERRATRRAISTQLAEVDAGLLDLRVAPDEWDVLYRLRLQVERDALSGQVPRVVAASRGRDPLAAPAPSEAAS